MTPKTGSLAIASGRFPDGSRCGGGDPFGDPWGGARGRA
jgi:hypothetical protein